MNEWKECSGDELYGSEKGEKVLFTRGADAKKLISLLFLILIESNVERLLNVSEQKHRSCSLTMAVYETAELTNRRVE